MTPLAVAPLRRLPLAVALLSFLAAAAGRAGAQGELSHTEDASAVPRGMLRLRIANAWTRYDQRYGANGLAALGEELSTPALGTAQLPLLAPIETAIQSLAADSRTRLSLGQLVVRGDARVVTTPVALEYGLTRRLTVGVMVPVVQTRRTIGITVNAAAGAPANVGFVPASRRDVAAQTNASARTSALAAAQQIGSFIARCQANPAGAGCDAYTRDPAGAAAAQARATQLANAAGALGTTAAAALLAPRDSGLFALEIEIQRNALNEQLATYFGTGAVVASAVYYAPTSFSYLDLQGGSGVPGLLQSPLGGGLDSIRTVERVGIGDVAVGAQYLLFDGFRHDTLPRPRVQSRLAIGGAVRFATSRADTATNLVDIGTGDGAGVELRSALDVIVGRVGGTVAARYVKAFARTVSAPLLGDPEAAFPLPSFGQRERTAGDVVGLDVTPRYLLSETFALDGHYGLERTGATTYGAVTSGSPLPAFCSVVSCDPVAGTTRTAQRLGLGIRYSTVDAYLRGAVRLPIEASYTHLTTISGNPGVAKESREQIQVRIYYRLFGR